MLQSQVKNWSRTLSFAVKRVTVVSDLLVIACMENEVKIRLNSGPAEFLQEPSEYEEWQDCSWGAAGIIDNL